MKGVLTMLGLAMAVAAGPVTAAGGQGPGAKAPDGAPEWMMRTYVLAFLYAGPTETEDKEKKNELQRAHLENIERLSNEGKIILAGPFLDKGDLRGIFLFDTEKLEEARAWCDTDPAIAAGALRMDLKPWYSAAGIMIDQPAAHHAKRAREEAAGKAGASGGTEAK